MLIEKHVYSLKRVIVYTQGKLGGWTLTHEIIDLRINAYGDNDAVLCESYRSMQLVGQLWRSDSELTLFMIVLRV